MKFVANNQKELELEKGLKCHILVWLANFKNKILLKVTFRVCVANDSQLLPHNILAQNYNRVIASFVLVTILNCVESKS